MGNRLVICVWDNPSIITFDDILNGKLDNVKSNLLAIAYYHWDAFTVESESHYRNIKKFRDTIDIANFSNYTEYAINMLESTGARLAEEYNGREVDEEKLNRNEGLIYFSENEMYESLTFAEEITNIFLDYVYIECKRLSETFICGKNLAEMIRRSSR